MSTIAIAAVIWVLLCTIIGLVLMTRSMGGWDTWLGAVILILCIVIGLVAAFTL